MEKGINVVRAADMDHGKEINLDGVKTDGYCAFSARDLIFYYHDCAYEAPTPTISRLLELEAYYWIMK